MKKSGPIGLLAVTMALWTGGASAHYLWIERDGGGVHAYFGEWERDLRELTGGRLDRIASPRAFLRDRNDALPIARQSNRLAIAAQSPGDVRLVEDGLIPSNDPRAGGKTKTVFYAREGRAETKPVLDFEIVPVALGGDTFTVLLRGVALAKQAVTVFGPPRWEKPLTTDSEGRLTVPMPWAGRYVIEAVHVEETPGGTGADAFSRLRHVSTLSFSADKGVPWSER